MSAEQKSDYLLEAIEQANAENTAVDEERAAFEEEKEARTAFYEAELRAETATSKLKAAHRVAHSAVRRAFWSGETDYDSIDTGIAILGSKKNILPRLDEATLNRARGIQQALVDRFDLQSDEIGLIIAHEADQSKAVVVDYAPRGIAEGSYDEIMNPSNVDQYTIAVGDKTYDTRKGMTKATYEAFLRAFAGENEINGQRLLHQFDTRNRHFSNEQLSVYSATLLTGDLINNQPGYGYNRNAIPYFLTCTPFDIYDSRNSAVMKRQLLFRPAVVIE